MNVPAQAAEIDLEDRATALARQTARVAGVAAGVQSSLMVNLYSDLL